MKKILLLLFILPIYAWGQQDHFELCNPLNIQNDNVGPYITDIFFNSQNQPIVIGNLYSGNNSIFFKLNNGSWDSIAAASDIVIALCRDNNGNTWFNSGSLLNKFDGDSISQYYSGCDINRWCLTYDKDDSLLWFVNNYTGYLTSFNPYTNQTDSITFLSQIDLADIQSIVYSSGKIFLLGNQIPNRIVSYDLNSQSETLVSFPSTQGSLYEKLTTDKKGFVYYSKSDLFYNLLFRINPITLNGYSILDTMSNATSNPEIAIDEQFNIWFMNGLYLQKFDTTGNILTSYSYDVINSITNYWPRLILTRPMSIDSSGCLWGCGEIAPDWLSGEYMGCVFKYSSNGFSNITGKIFNDLNSNGNFDAGETPLPNQIVFHNQNSYANSDDSGEYYLKFIDSTLTYNVQPIIPNYWQCQSTCSYTVTPSVQLNSNYDFGLTPTGNYDDVNVAVTSTPSRPGFISTQNILVKNVGTTTNTPALTYQFEAQQNFVSAIPTPTSVNGNTLTWNLNSLTPFQQQNIQLWFSLPSSVAIGTPITSIAIVQGSGTENTPADNIDSLNQIVVGAFDPNEKTVSPMGNINSGDWLTYTIYFQNTGTDTAFIVTVFDTLDSDLDFSTINIVGFSHPMTWQIKGAGFLKFSFNNILLPDSNTNEALSHGYVSYRIKSKTGLQNGTHINNTASIYFDFNSSVVTNTTSTIIGSVGIADLNENSFSIVPTIASSGETIQIINGKIGDELKLIDCTGRILAIEKMISSSTQMQTKNLSAGIYFIQCGNAVKKLVVQ